MDFVFGDESLLTDVDFVKRRINAEKLKSDDIAVDRDAASITVRGSAKEPYYATLAGCTCPDFAFRSIPCKHMIRLAVELGMMEPLRKVSKKQDKQVIAAETDRWLDMFETGQVSAALYVRVAGALRE